MPQSLSGAFLLACWCWVSFTATAAAAVAGAVGIFEGCTGKIEHTESLSHL